MNQKYNIMAFQTRILSDDSSSWVDDITDDGETNQQDVSDTTDWVDKVTNDKNNSQPGTQESETNKLTDPTVKVSHYECDNCGMIASRCRHEECDAPIIYIGGSWQCGECGTGVPSKDNCFDCGGTVVYEPMPVQLNLTPEARIKTIEQAIHQETNSRRTDHSIDTLEYNHHLSAIALQHSRDMAERGFFDHTSPDGDEPIDRYRTFGHNDRSSGENIACIPLDPTSTAQDAVHLVVEEWMQSPGHRENLLREQFTEEGIGIYFTPNGSMYATQNFY